MPASPDPSSAGGGIVSAEMLSVVAGAGEGGVADAAGAGAGVVGAGFGAEAGLAGVVELGVFGCPSGLGGAGVSGTVLFDLG